MTSSIYEVVPKRKTSIIRNTKIILNLPNEHIVTNYDVDQMKVIIFNHINIDNLSPFEIAKKYNIKTKSYHIFISKTLGIKLKSCKDAANNYLQQNKRNITDERKLYNKNCQFNFSPYQEENILGYDLLKDYTFSKPQNKIAGKKYLHRDHMVSISYGYENNISSEIISHPANCHIIFEDENINKGSSCSISLETLLERIDNWNKNTLDKNPYISKTYKMPKIHREKIAKAIIGKRLYNDGFKNFYVNPHQTILPEWKKGRLK